MDGSQVWQNNHTLCREGAPVSPRPGGGLACVDRTLFVLWGFPELSELFIHREMMHMEEMGATVWVLASHRVPRDDLPATLDSIASRAEYLGPAFRWVPRAVGFALRHALHFISALAWMLALPHRTLWHRLRAAGLVLAAASVAGRVQASGICYIQAHFAAYHTEWAMALSRLTQIPFGFTGHATGIWRDRNILPEKLRHARLALTCTQCNVEHLRELAPKYARKVHLVHHGLDLQAVPDATSLPRRRPSPWLAVGRLVPKKGFDTLLEALSMLRARGIDIALTIVGEGPERERLESSLVSLELAGRVHLVGALPNAEVWALLQGAYAFAAPSRRDAAGNVDGIPNVVLEAMAMARPVVGSRLSGIPEVVIHEQTGLLVPPEEPRLLADAIERVTLSPDQAEAWGKRGQALVRQHFDIRHNVRKQLAYLQQAAELEEPR